MYAVPVSIARIFPSGGVGFTRVKHAVEIRVFFPVIKSIAVGVVVPRVAGLSRVAVGTVDFDTVTDAVVVGIGGCRVGKQGEGFIGIVQPITVRVGYLGVG